MNDQQETDQRGINQHELEGMRILVTGARKGIGRGVALHLAEHGAHVGINDLQLDDVTKATLTRIEAYGGRASAHVGDMSRCEDIRQVVAEFIAVHGGIDALVNNAITPDQKRPLFDVDEAYWEQMMDLSLKGYFFAAQAAAKAMVDAGTGGVIICLSSVHAATARPDWTTYGTAKAALERLVEGLAADLAGTGVRANCIAPGAIRNVLPDDLGAIDPEPYSSSDLPVDAARIPLRRGGLPSDIAGAVRFLCSEAGSYINGITLRVDGGLEAVRDDL